MSRPKDPLTQLKDANPNPVGDTGEPQPLVGFDTQLREIMTTTLPTQKQFGQPNLARKWLPRAAVPLVGTAAAVGIVIASPFGSTEPAFAQVQAAVETSSSYDSGSILIRGEFDELEESSSGGYSFTQKYRFDGNDFQLATDHDNTEESELVVIGDQVYHKGYWPENLAYVSHYILSERDKFAEEASGVYPATSRPEYILPLLKESDDFKLESSDGDVRTFTGSIPRETLGALAPNEVPAGLFMLAVDNEIDTLPKTISIEVVVDDGALSQLGIEVKGDTSRGFVDATLTSTFTEFGQPQSISPPPSDQVITESDYWGDVTEGKETVGDGAPHPETSDEAVTEETAFTITLGFEEANPELCQEEAEEMLSTVVPPPGTERTEFEQFEETAIELTKTWAACMKAHADDPEVIEAYELIYRV